MNWQQRSDKKQASEQAAAQANSASGPASQSFAAGMAANKDRMAGGAQDPNSMRSAAAAPPKLSPEQRLDALVDSAKASGKSDIGAFIMAVRADPKTAFDVVAQEFVASDLKPVSDTLHEASGLLEEWEQPQIAAMLSGAGNLVEGGVAAIKGDIKAAAHEAVDMASDGLDAFGPSLADEKLGSVELADLPVIGDAITKAEGGLQDWLTETLHNEIDDPGLPAALREAADKKA